MIALSQSSLYLSSLYDGARFITIMNSNSYNKKHNYPYQSPLPKSSIHSHNTQPFYTTSSSFSTIDPAWHLIASLESVLAPRILKKQKIFFDSIKDYSYGLQKAFINHCAIMIQKNFRGYLQAKRYKQFLPIYRRLRGLLSGMVAGWRIRKIMKLKVIEKKVKQIRKLEQANQMKKVRIMKRDLVYEIKELQRRGQWLQLYKTQSSQASKIKKPNNRKVITLKSAFYPQNGLHNEKKQTSKTRKVSLNLNSRVNDPQKLSNNNQNIPENIGKVQQERPIQTKGFYEFQEPIQETEQPIQEKNKPKSQFDNKKKKSWNNKNKAQEKGKQEEQNSKLKKIGKPDEKIMQFDTSILEICLPVEQQLVDIEINSKTTTRPLKLKPTTKQKQRPLLQIVKKKNMSKGISLTLNSQPSTNSPVSNFIISDGFQSQIIKSQYTPSNYQQSQFLATLQIPQKEMEQYGVQTTMRQILQAYTGPYLHKKQQIHEKLSAIKSQQKFNKANFHSK